PIALIHSAEADRDLARRLLSRYGKGRAEGKLSRQEDGLDEATFKQLDADGDGALDAGELARFGLRGPDVAMTSRLAVNAVRGMPAEVRCQTDLPAPLAANLRPLPQGVVLDLGAGRCEVVSEDRPNQPNIAQPLIRQLYKAQFANADKGNKGYLERREAENN